MNMTALYEVIQIQRDIPIGIILKLAIKSILGLFNSMSAIL